MDAKGWHAPHQVSFIDDLRAGRMLAALDRAAAATTTPLPLPGRAAG